jgi:hypothetical protein
MAACNIADRHAGLRRLATTASLSSVEKRRLRATPLITSTFEYVSHIGMPTIIPRLSG